MPHKASLTSHYTSTEESNYQLMAIYVYFYFMYYHNYYVICTLYVNSMEESKGVTQINYSPKSTQAGHPKIIKVNENLCNHIQRYLLTTQQLQHYGTPDVKGVK